eukprot:gene31479-37137_t
MAALMQSVLHATTEGRGNLVMSRMVLDLVVCAGGDLPEEGAKLDRLTSLTQLRVWSGA